MTTIDLRCKTVIADCLPRLVKAIETIAAIKQKESRKCCCICGKEITNYGNNAYPYGTTGNDRCCDECNITKVIPERIRLTSKKEK